MKLVIGTVHHYNTPLADGFPETEGGRAVNFISNTTKSSPTRSGLITELKVMSFRTPETTGTLYNEPRRPPPPPRDGVTTKPGGPGRHAVGAAVRARSTDMVMKHMRMGGTSATWGERVAHSPGDDSSRAERDLEQKVLCLKRSATEPVPSFSSQRCHGFRSVKKTDHWNIHPHRRYFPRWSLRCCNEIFELCW